MIVVSRRWPIRVLGVVVIALAVASGVQSCTQAKTNTWQAAETQQIAEETRRLAECLKRYGDGTADAIDARAASATAAAAALDELFEAFLKATPDEAGRDRAWALFEDYVTKRRAARQAQAEHPYPPPPRDLC